MKKTFDISSDFGRLMRAQAKLDEFVTVPEEDAFSKKYDGLDFYDDISGAPLDRSEAIKARKLEMSFFKRKGVYTKVQREAWM